MRGTLTEEVSATMQKMGLEGTVEELRFMPYLMYCLLDNTSVGRDKLSLKERELFRSWFDKGWVKTSNYGDTLVVSEEFYKKILKTLRIGYLSSVIRRK